MSKHDMETTIQLPDEEDVDVHIDFEVTDWGSPPTAASWNYPGDPGDPAEFDILNIIRLDNDKDITAEFDAMPDDMKQKVWELIAERVYEIDQERGYDYD